MGGGSEKEPPACRQFAPGSRTVATVGTVATKRRVGGLRPAEGDCAGTEPSCQAAEGVHTRRRFFGIGAGKLANRGTPATCMAGSNSTSESGIAGDLLDAGISGREGQAPATRPSATMAASRSEYYGRAFTCCQQPSRRSVAKIGNGKTPASSSLASRMTNSAPVTTGALFVWPCCSVPWLAKS